MSRNPKTTHKYNDCLSCKQIRYIVSRGLCMGCWRDESIRNKFKDKRLVPRNPMTAEQVAILNNPLLTEPRKLFFLAWRKKTRYGPRIQVDDLIQIGWLMMIKGIKDYDTNWSNSLFHFCKVGISSEMERHCYLEIRSSTMGTSHEDFVDFIDNDYQDRLMKAGGLSRYTLGMTFNITDHALERYRQRFNASGTRKELYRYVEHSSRLPIERQLIWLSHKENNSTSNEVREYGDMIFIMGPCRHLWSKQQQLITVLNRLSPF